MDLTEILPGKRLQNTSTYTVITVVAVERHTGLGQYEMSRHKRATPHSSKSDVLINEDGNEYRVLASLIQKHFGRIK